MAALPVENGDNTACSALVTKLASPDPVIPADYPGLRGLAWNRDPSRPMLAGEAFAVYERNWRHIDEAALTVAERRLVDALKDRFGGGAFLG